MLADTFPDASDEQLEAASSLIVQWANEGVVDAVDALGENDEVSGLIVRILAGDIELTAGDYEESSSLEGAQGRLNELRPLMRLPWRRPGRLG